MNRIKKLFLFLTLLISLQSVGQTEVHSFNELYQLIEQKDFFKAEKIYSQTKGNLSLTEQQYIEAFLDNAFNRLAKSQQKITSLVEEKARFPDSLMINLYQIKKDNALKTYQYKEAKKAVSTLLHSYKKKLTEAEIKDLKNDFILWKALENVPRQKIKISQKTILKMEKDLAGLNNLKVSTQQDTVNFIFDTGANLSTTSLSVARKLQMKLIPVNIEVNAITGNQVTAQLAVCKKLTLGNIELKNVVFLVFEDENLAFPQINYQIYGILGFPVIEALKEIQITQDGYFIVPKVETSFSGSSNMAMNGLTPLICIDQKPYSFDTGADKTILYQATYLDNQKIYDDQYELQKITFGGAGGVKEFEGYNIDYTFTVNSEKIILPSLQLLKEKINEKESLYGNIGQDLISHFLKMTLNFNQMFIRFEK